MPEPQTLDELEDAVAEQLGPPRCICPAFGEALGGGRFRCHNAAQPGGRYCGYCAARRCTASPALAASHA